MTLKEALGIGREKLRQCETDTPWLDAMVLLGEALHMTKEQIYMNLDDHYSDGTLERFFHFLEKHAAGDPVSYILGRKEFYGREFHVDPRVLVPRPDTEIIVETALELAASPAAGIHRPVRILDLCTGSGCIAVTIAAEAEASGLEVFVTGSDISPDALDVFRANSRTLLGYELPAVESDLFAGITGTFDIIVSNPPYLTTEEVSAPHIQKWPEPKLALDGGEDGLDAVRTILHKGMDYLDRNSYLLLEASPDQMDSIESLFILEKYRNIRRKKDLGNRERVIFGNR